MSKYFKTIQALVRKTLKDRLKAPRDLDGDESQNVRSWFKQEMVKSKKDFKKWLEDHQIYK